MDKLKLRIDFLKELLAMNNTSGNELEIGEICIKELTTLGFMVEKDEHGNVYATRGHSNEYPLLNAHMDMVDMSYSAYSYLDRSNRHNRGSIDVYDFESNDKTNYIFDYLQYEGIIDVVPSCDTCRCKYKCQLDSDCETGSYEKYETSYITKYSEIKRVRKEFPVYYAEAECSYNDYDSYNNIYSNYYGYDDNITITKDDWKLVHKKGKIYGKGGNRVLGGDDKNGIFITLEVARLNPKLPMKVLFTVEEETGCVGVNKFLRTNSEWLNDVKYSLTIDRKEGNHLLTSQCGVRSMGKVLGNKLKVEGEKVGINVLIQDGFVSDTIHLREYVPSVNMSAGYYSAHTESEYVKVKDVVAITEWVSGIVNNV